MRGQGFGRDRVQGLGALIMCEESVLAVCVRTGSCQSLPGALVAGITGKWKTLNSTLKA